MGKIKLEIYWGSYLAFTFILWSQLEKWLGFHSDKLFIQPIFSILITIPFSILYLPFRDTLEHP